MRKVGMAVSATSIMFLGVLALVRPAIWPNASLIFGLMVIVMGVSSLSGQSSFKNRRLPSPWRTKSGLARLQLLFALLALVCIGIGFALPNRFTPATMGWSWLGWGFIGYSWLLSQIRLEREGLPKESGGKDSASQD